MRKEQVDGLFYKYIDTFDGMEGNGAEFPAMTRVAFGEAVNQLEMDIIAEIHSEVEKLAHPFFGDKTYVRLDRVLEKISQLENYE